MADQENLFKSQALEDAGETMNTKPEAKEAIRELTRKFVRLNDSLEPCEQPSFQALFERIDIDSLKDEKRKKKGQPLPTLPIIIPKEEWTPITLKEAIDLRKKQIMVNIDRFTFRTSVQDRNKLIIKDQRTGIKYDPDDPELNQVIVQAKIDKSTLGTEYTEYQRWISGAFEGPKRKVESVLTQSLRSTPTPTEFAPVPIEIPESNLITGSGQEHELSLKPNSGKVITMQQNGLLPSLFNANSFEQLEQNPTEVILLFDVSGSTEHYDIYKLANIACISVKQEIESKIPGVKVSILIYNDSTAPYKPTDGFVYPGGGTDYEKAFIASQSRLRMSSTPNKVVINLSDGIPNDLEKAVKAAKKYRGLNTEYGQIIFGHDVSFLAKSVLRDVLTQLGADPKTVHDMDSYQKAFTSVAKAANGSQLVLWVSHQLPNTLYSLIDLAIGFNFFKNRR